MSLSSMESFLQERAEWLAKLWITRRTDLQVTSIASSESTDLLVTILRDGRPIGGRFEVLVKTEVVTERLEYQLQGKNLKILPESDILNRLNQAAWPVLLFYFKMRQDDQAFYRWLVEPVIDDNSHPRTQCRVHRDGELSVLTDTELEKLVSRINRWYAERERY